MSATSTSLELAQRLLHVKPEPIPSAWRDAAQLTVTPLYNNPYPKAGESEKSKESYEIGNRLLTDTLVKGKLENEAKEKENRWLKKVDRQIMRKEAEKY